MPAVRSSCVAIPPRVPGDGDRPLGLALATCAAFLCCGAAPALAVPTEAPSAGHTAADHPAAVAASALLAPAATPTDGPVLDLDGAEAFEAAPAEAASAGARGPALHLDGVGDDNAARALRYRTSLLNNLTDKLGAMGHPTVLGGYGEVEFRKESGQDSRFVHHRYVLFIYSEISPRVSTSTEFEVEFGGSPAKRDGVMEAGEALLEFAVVDLRLTDWLTVRGGIVLVPFGAFNLRHDAPTRDLTDRPMALTTVTPTTWFEAGAGILGGWSWGDTRLSYELYAINGLDARISEAHGLKGAIGSKGEDNNDDKALVGRFAFSPSLGLELAVSGYSGAYDDVGARVGMVGADLTWRLGRLELLGEYTRAFIDPGFVQGFSLASEANTRVAVPVGMAGWYAQANWHFRIPWLWSVLPDDLVDSTLTASLRVEAVDTDTAVVDSYDAERLTLGLNWRPVEAFVWKNELQLTSRAVDGQPHHLLSGAVELEPSWVSSFAFLF